MPCSPFPRSWMSVLLRSKSLDTSTCSGSSTHSSICTGSCATRSHVLIGARTRGARGHAQATRQRRAARRSRRGLALQPADQLVEPQLLERARYRRQLARALLDQGLALADQLQGLVEARVARVEPLDDRFNARRRLLVALRLRQCGASVLLR